MELKEKKLRMEDALAATRAAVEEGIISGGGSAYIHCIPEVSKIVEGLSGDEKTGANIILTALEAPLKQIVNNAGLEGSVIVSQVKGKEVNQGFNALTGEFVNMIDAGILDPAKVTKSALLNANSVASTVLTTDALVADTTTEEPMMPGANPMGMM